MNKIKEVFLYVVISHDNVILLFFIHDCDLCHLRGAYVDFIYTTYSSYDIINLSIYIYIYTLNVIMSYIYSSVYEFPYMFYAMYRFLYVFSVYFCTT